MSQWQTAVRRLHALGGIATTSQVDEMTNCRADKGLAWAKHYGLVESNGCQGARRESTWTLTRLGEDWVMNRVEPRFYQYAGPKSKFTPTWLASLPRDIRINSEETA